MVVSLIIVVGTVSFIGEKLISPAYAESPYGMVNVDTGSISGMATNQTCTGSNDGNCVVFGTTINPTPIGPAAPVSGWHVDLADDFNAPLGTGSGQDNLWYPSQTWNPTPTNNANGDNPNETEVYNSSQVSVSNGNLALSANYQNDVAPATGNGSGDDASDYTQRNYVAGIVTSPTTISGYKGFNLTFGDGSSWAFEIVCQWPLNTGELWNAFATNSPGEWVGERDFFEGKSPSGYIDTDWIYSTPNTGGKQQDYYNTTLGFDPSAAMHRYTYVVYPDTSWSFYIDGVLQTWVGNDGVSPPETGDNTPLEIAMNYALDATTFTTGTRQFLIDSVAVYQDNAHAGTDTTGGGIAPDTVVNGQ